MAIKSFEDLIASGYVKQAAAELAALGAASYSVTSDNHYAVSLRQEGTDTMPSLREAFHAANSAAESLPSEIDTEFNKAGFISFRPLASGEDADVIRATHANGHRYAVRISTNTREHRVISPLMLQPYATYAQDKYKMEVMPEIQILTPDDPEYGSVIPGEQKHIPLSEGVTYVAERVIHKIMDFGLIMGGLVIKDIGILPDGTLIQPDPSQISYVDRGMRQKPDLIRQALQNLHSQGRALNLPEAFNWLTQDGTWKQDQFFANPFKTTPQYRGFAPLI